MRVFSQQGFQLFGDLRGVAALEHYRHRQLFAQARLGVHPAELRHGIGLYQLASLIGVGDHFFQQFVLLGLVGHQEHGVDHLGEHGWDLPANTQGQALLLGLGEITTEHQPPDILQLGRVNLGFFRLASETGVGQYGFFQRLRVRGGHSHHPVSVGEGVVRAKAACQLRPGLAQFVA